MDKTPLTCAQVAQVFFCRHAKINHEIGEVYKNVALKLVPLGNAPIPDIFFKTFDEDAIREELSALDSGK